MSIIIRVEGIDEHSLYFEIRKNNIAGRNMPAVIHELQTLIFIIQDTETGTVYGDGFVNTGSGDLPVRSDEEQVETLFQGLGKHRRKIISTRNKTAGRSIHHNGVGPFDNALDHWDSVKAYLDLSRNGFPVFRFEHNGTDPLIGNGKTNSATNIIECKVKIGTRSNGRKHFIGK